MACHKMSQNVTKCHKMSQGVTKCHQMSQNKLQAGGESRRHWSLFTCKIWLRYSPAENEPCQVCRIPRSPLVPHAAVEAARTSRTGTGTGGSSSATPSIPTPASSVSGYILQTCCKFWRCVAGVLGCVKTKFCKKICV